MLETKQIRRCQRPQTLRENIAVLHNPNNIFILLDFLSKHDTIHFETTIGYVKEILMFYYCSYNHPLSGAGEAS